MKRIIILTAGLLGCFLIMPAFGQSMSDQPNKEAASHEVKKKDGETGGITKESILQKKERYQHAAEDKLRKIEQKLKRFKARAEKAENQVKQKMHDAGTELNNKKEAAKDKLRDLKMAGEDKWDKMKSEMDSVMKDLEKSYNRAVSRFNGKKQN